MGVLVLVLVLVLAPSDTRCYASEMDPRALLTPIAWCLAIVLGGLAALHLSWARGASTAWGYLAALPTRADGQPLFLPGPLACAAVALLLSLAGAVPANAATNVPVAQKMSATFSEAMDPLTITTATMTLSLGTSPVSSTVTLSGATVTLTPAVALSYSTHYTVAITTGAKDLAGNPLTSAFTWSFDTAAAVALGPPKVSLLSAGNYVVLAKASIASVPSSVVTGDIAVSPAAASPGRRVHSSLGRK